MAFYANAVFNQLNAEMFGFYMHSNELAKNLFLYKPQSSMQFFNYTDNDDTWAQTYE